MAEQPTSDPIDWQSRVIELEAQLSVVTRALRVISAGNQALLRATEETSLLQSICHLVVEEGGYRFAWVGYPQTEGDKWVLPIAQAGQGVEYLQAITLTWDESSIWAQGPVGKAIRTGQPSSARNILTDINFAPWRRVAVEQGYASCLALPLLDQGLTFGSLAIYASEADAFDTEEARLLQKLSENLAYGIIALRHEQGRRTATEELHRIQARNQALLNAIPDLMIRMDQDGNYLDFVPAKNFETVRPVAEMRNQNLFDVMPLPIAQQRMEYIQQALQTGEVQVYEYQLEWPDKRISYQEGRIVVSGDQEVLVIVRDITLRKQAEIQLQQQAASDRLLAAIALQIRQSLNLQDILQRAITEIQQFLQVDRVVLFRFDAQGEGEAIVESRQEACPSLLGTTMHQAWLNGLITAYLQHGPRPIADVEKAPFLPVAIQEEFQTLQIRSVFGVPILQEGSLLGMLSVQHCSGPRTWQPFEVGFLEQIATQLAIAIQQAELYNQVQQLNATLEQQVQERTVQFQQSLNFEALLKRITDKVRDHLDEDLILQTAVQELGTELELYSCDTALYDLERATSTIMYEYVTCLPQATGEVFQLENFPDLYAQLLQGLYVQFCDIVGSNNRQLPKEIVILACPILDGEGVLGDMWFYRGPRQVFNEMEIRLVQQVANQCAIAIRQARLYQAAQAQVRELEKLNQLKDDFLSTVSHELRTPIANMKMAIHLLHLSTTAERRQQYLTILQTECNREAELIEDLLDLQHLETDRHPITPAAIDLATWLPSIIEPFSSRTQARQQVLQINLPPNLSPLVSHALSLERILAELLNNACKYTASAGKISVQICQKFAVLPGNEAPIAVTCFQICNQAVIPAAELPLIFEKFYRVPNSDPWRQGGTGLGLALVQKLVGQLKGNIQVESGEAGTLFTIQLPDLAPA